jgi:A/G-specific adenine glycosylase
MAGSAIVRSKSVVSDAAPLRRALLAWYRRHRRVLPWRESHDPYRVWVSEVMLQQTQVATAIPYYERFVKLFPDVRTLARARRERVLAAWAGLGYYRRAGHLHEAAGIVMREHAGRVPSEPRAFGALPGVGRYTLGAVLSIGFGSRLPVLDGNVARVLARLAARPLAVKRPADARTLWAMAEALLPEPAAPGRTARPAADAGDPGDWNQAMMELGATVCTPRAPRCDACPVRSWCRAHALGRPEAFPPAAERRTPEHLRRAIVLLTRRGRTLVVRREGALLGGLWEPPGVELSRGQDARAALARSLAGLGIRARLADSGVRLKHAITHRSITVEVWRAEPVASAPRAGARARWAAPGSRALALTALARRVIGDAGEVPVASASPARALARPVMLPRRQSVI